MKTIRDLTKREKRDINLLEENKIKLEVRDVKGTLVWYEEIWQEGRYFKLAYWYDGSEYKAIPIKGARKKDYGNLDCHLFDGGEICLHSDKKIAKYKSVLEARARAILWSRIYTDFLDKEKWPKKFDG